MITNWIKHSVRYNYQSSLNWASSKLWKSVKSLKVRSQQNKGDCPTFENLVEQMHVDQTIDHQNRQPQSIQHVLVSEDYKRKSLFLFKLKSHTHSPKHSHTTLGLSQMPFFRLRILVGFSERIFEYSFQKKTPSKTTLIIPIYSLEPILTVSAYFVEDLIAFER